MKGSKEQRDRALGVIYKNNKEKVCSFVLSNSGSEEEAKDIFQEAVIAFYENVRNEKFKGESTISTYLYSITRFKWLNQIKKNSVRKEHQESVVQEQFMDSPLATLMEGERKAGVLEVLALLGTACKDLLIENMYHGASMKEIAKNGLYSSEQIVRNKKYKCLQKLKELIGAKPALINVLKGNG